MSLRIVEQNTDVPNGAAAGLIDHRQVGVAIAIEVSRDDPQRGGSNRIRWVGCTCHKRTIADAGEDLHTTIDGVSGGNIKFAVPIKISYNHIAQLGGLCRTRVGPGP